MIKIGKPVIETKDGKAILKARIINDVEQKDDWLWYATDEGNGKFFTPEVADAFVLPMILRAVKTQQDIVVETSMSAKLYYNLNDAVLYAVGKAFERTFPEQEMGGGKSVLQQSCVRGFWFRGRWHRLFSWR